MSMEEAEAILQVSRYADFDLVARAKDKQIRKARADPQEIDKVEAAYDLMLMQRFKSRTSGEMNVDNSVRFADEPAQRAHRKAARMAKSLAVIQSRLKANVSQDGNQLAVLFGCYVFLLVWAFAQGTTASPATAASEVPGLQLALGFIGAVYYLREKKQLGLGRAFLYSAGGLAVGSAVGSLVEGWLRVDVMPFLGVSSPGIVVSEFGIVGIAAAAALLG